MRRLIVATFAVAALAAALSHSAARAEQLVIPGSGNPTFALTKLADAFNQRQAAHRVVIPPSSGMAGAIRDVTAGTAALGRAGRPLTDEERGTGLAFVSLGRDAVVFAGGAGVSVRNITREQVLAVYSGKFTDWRELGGPPGPIRAIGRERTDSSFRAISLQLPSFDTLAFHDSVKFVHLDPEEIALLDRYPTSLGFLNRSGLLSARTPLVVMAFDGIEPSPANLAAGRYPLWQELGLIHRSGRLSEGANAFVAFIRSAEGVAILRKLGFVAADGAP